METETIMRQAQMTAADYMDAAVVVIDNRNGAGYAKQHPELVAGFMITAALDFLACFSKKSD